MSHWIGFQYSYLFNSCWILMLRMTSRSAQQYMLIQDMLSVCEEEPARNKGTNGLSPFRIILIIFNECIVVCMFCNVVCVNCYKQQLQKSEYGAYCCICTYLVLRKPRPSWWPWMGDESRMGRYHCQRAHPWRHRNRQVGYLATPIEHCFFNDCNKNLHNA